MEKVIFYITSPQLQDELFPIKVLFLGFAVIFFLIIVFGFLKTQRQINLFFERIFQFLTFKSISSQKMSKDWSKILTKLKSPVESDYKIAVIEADNLLDEVFEKAGYSGKNLKERLDKINPSLISNIEELKKVRLIRDKIISEPNYKLDLEQAKKILDIYKETFHSLKFF